MNRFGRFKPQNAHKKINKLDPQSFWSESDLMANLRVCTVRAFEIVNLQ